ncbi:hypothetical protein ATANTOWER_013136 [Ataeniobius toweri]|uniref:Uncharacterized protein n=1 Tax=Ataeniobius toweri TaxID=208326 RepID=A0ABU7BSC5_9TELE|nr:hypothetical protein [Ataeniobius toweri]
MPQSAADSSCLNALHDEAQPLNTLAGFMCVLPPNESVVLQSLVLLFSTSFHVFFINEGFVSQPVFSVITGAQFTVDTPRWMDFFPFKRKRHIFKIHTQFVPGPF